MKTKLESEDHIIELMKKHNITISEESMLKLHIRIESYLFDIYKNQGYSKYEILAILEAIIWENTD